MVERWLKPGDHVDKYRPIVEDQHLPSGRWAAIAGVGTVK
jgi:hypothetical protein